MTKVFGHLNPDTDSTASAIAYAWLLKQGGADAVPHVLGAPNKEATYVLERFGFATPELQGALSEGEEVVIVDTNNPAELPEGIAAAKVVGIIDHHKLAGLTTMEPLAVTMRPIACTATIIYGLAKERGVELPANLAGLLLSAILSDTLKFTSPTTTDEDRDAADALAALAGIDLEELAAAMFAAKSDLTGMAPKDILLSDSKLFQMGGRKVRVSSLETTDASAALGMEADLLAGIEALKAEEGTELLFFFVVDILNSASTLLLPGEAEKEAAATAFGKEIVGSRMGLPGVVSRKKQMVPPLEAALS